MGQAKHVIKFRRKRTGRTNYKKRLALLKSGKPRLVVRVSNKHVQLQLVNYDADGDKVLVTINSKILLKQGWKHSTKSLTAAYCTGHIFGQAAKDKKISEAIVDLGLQQHRSGTRIYAAIKGAVDAGLNIPVSDSVFPPPERLRGEHLTSVKADEVTALMKKLNITPPAGEKLATEKKAPKAQQEA
ncbi:50S ribosomal protein L18 [Candidatus Woesearchaeota archaeon]|nr:50S ribosomal protein L18 [Candidatus Woesearchaeota archaeon]